MKNVAVLIILFVFICSNVRAQELSGDSDMSKLYLYAGRNLNYSSQAGDVNAISLCDDIEASALKNKDYYKLFFARQIAINTYCLRGDVELAVSKAQQMYSDAKKINNELAITLAIQSIATTYIYSNQKEKALETFNEASSRMSLIDNNLLKIRLLLQQIHACVLMDKFNLVQHYLDDVRKLLNNTHISNKSDYLFYEIYYQALCDIEMNKTELAIERLQQVKAMNLPDSIFGRWRFNIKVQLYSASGEYDKALIYCDSTIEATLKSGNMIEYKMSLLDKIALLEKNGMSDEACDAYEAIIRLSDSLNISHYGKQIDSLHATFIVDQIAVAKVERQNRNLIIFIIFGVCLIITSVIIILTVKKKNKKLVESRELLKIVGEEATASIHSKNLFLSNMSHELRTPLNAIVGFSMLLSTDDTIDSDTRKEIGGLVNQNSDLLIKLFRDVADISALKGGNIQFNFSECEAVTICRNVIGTIDKVKTTAAAVIFKTDIDSITLYTDPGRLQQVIINLLINATKFTAKGTITLTLEFDKKKNEAVFIVEDTGCGIPLAKQPHIFERFEKLHEGVQGAGLGLSICVLIIEHIGGRIWVDPEYTKGARFIFTHPLKPVNINTNSNTVD